MTWRVGSACVLAAAGLLMIALAAVEPFGPAAIAQPVTQTGRQAVVPGRPYPADSLAALAVARNVFRAERRPARVAYEPGRSSAPVPPPLPKPMLILAGILWAEEPSAVLEGMPGVEGSRVARVGDVVSGLTVREIHRTHVIVAGMDTTWVLTVKEPWRE